jgi:hypothetical protein
MSDDISVVHKTGRIALLCTTLAILGFFYFLFKVGACAECGKPKPQETPICKDEFVEIRGDNDRYAIKHTCEPGAIVEVVNSPPAPKPGIICHCSKTSGAVPGTASSLPRAVPDMPARAL